VEGALRHALAIAQSSITRRSSGRLALRVVGHGRGRRRPRVAWTRAQHPAPSPYRRSNL